MARIDRRQKAAGTTRRPADVGMSQTYYGVVRLVGLGLGLFGLVFLLGNL